MVRRHLLQGKLDKNTNSLAVTMVAVEVPGIEAEAQHILV